MEWLEITKWWIILEVIGFAALPLTALVFGKLDSKGVYLSKILGLLIITYLSWALAHFSVNYNTVSVFVSVIILLALSLLILSKKNCSLDRNELLRIEVLFTVSFLFFAMLRSFSPEIYWGGGEKFMDMSFINIILRSSSFPPMDPWLSGENMQYYYFGYLLVANLIKLSFVPPAIGFNLGIATMFALSATAAYGLGRDLTKNWRFGWITMAFVVIFGNPAGFIQLLVILFSPKYYSIFNVPDSDLFTRLFSFYYWPTSRVIPNTINEFPFFSFIHGDLHAHMISIAFQLLMIALLLCLLRGGKEYDIPVLAAIALLLGFMFGLNTWEYPTYAIFFIMVLIVRWIRVLREDNDIHGFRDLVMNLRLNEFAKTTGVGLIVGISSILLYLPYHLASTESHSINIVTSGQTELIFYLGVYGVMLFFIMLYTITGFYDSYRPDMKIILPGLAVAACAAYLTHIQVLIIILPLVVMSGYCLLMEEDPTARFVFLLILVGALLSLFCELFYIQDSLGIAYPKYIRLNTVFKIYMQNWIIWGLAAGFSLHHLWNKWVTVNKTNKGFVILSVFMVAAAMSYPVFAVQSRANNFSVPATLDGSAYIREQYPGEYSAVVWLNNLSETPVVLQSPGNLYELNNHVTAFTGLPTVIGWAGHEKNWRNNNRNIDLRWNEIHRLYNSGNIDEVNPVLDKYNVEYIYIGGVEEERYGGYDARRGFEEEPDRFELVYSNPDVHIYKVVRQ